jgi:long-chain fatty acid transport protein
MKTKLSVVNGVVRARHVVWSCLAGLALFQCRNAAAVGFRLPNQDPEAIARGNAFAATADDPAAIYYNPAGITQLSGTEVEAGIYAVSSGVRYTSAATGETFKTKSNFQPVPEFYAVHSLTNLPLSFGLGVYVPYGLAVDWGDQTSFRTLAEHGSVLYACVNPVAAWQILPSLSIGGGPTINYSKAIFERGVTPRPDTDQFRFVGNDVAFGFNAGVRWQPHEMVSFGVNYRYGTTLNYRGNTVIDPYFPGSSASTASIKFPQFVVGGISFRPTKNWNIEFDLDWTDFAIDKQVVFNGTAVGNQTFLFNYRSSFMYEFGVTRNLPCNYFVSVGYFYSENSSPDANFNMIVPDSDLHLGSIGFGHKGKHWDWAAAYHFGFNPGRTVIGSQSSLNPNPFSETADGRYRAFNQGITASVTLKF